MKPRQDESGYRFMDRVVRHNGSAPRFALAGAVFTWALFLLAVVAWASGSGPFPWDILAVPLAVTLVYIGVRTRGTP